VPVTRAHRDLLVTCRRQDHRMTTGPTSPRPVAILVSGAATALYYATPDFIPSRTARGWAKLGITAVSLATAFPEMRAAWTAAGRRPEPAGGEPSPPVPFGSLPARSKFVLLGSGAVLAALSVRGVIAAERWAFRHGEARAVAGKRLPHTGPALLYGALASGLWFLPTPSPAD
jgi:hypothetical protein